MPNIDIVPLSGFISPVKILISVDFPAPLVPKSPVILFSKISKLILSKAFTSLYALETF